MNKRTVKVPGAALATFLPLSRLKSYARQASDRDDTDLTGLLLSAHQNVLDYLSMESLSEATITLSMDERPSQFLIEDMNAVTEIRTVYDDLTSTIEDSDIYLVDPPEVKLKVLKYWSIISTPYFYRFEIDYTTGWATVPDIILETILEVATLYYMDKGAPMPEKIMAAMTRIQGYRKRWF